jgi:hypothetical protein
MKGRGRKLIIRSICNPQMRSQYPSNRFRGEGVVQADAESRKWAEQNNASIVSYQEFIPANIEKAVSSKELKLKDQGLL